MMFRGAIYKSDNKGTNWVKASSSQTLTMTNDVYRGEGPKMAVDPVNQDIVVAGTPPDGIWMTTNAGASWSLITAMPVAGATGNIAIAFDPTTSVNGKTSTIYVGDWGNGVYVSRDAGVTWTWDIRRPP